MAIWRKPLQFINVMLANRSLMSVAERGTGRMTYATKKPFAEHNLRVTLQRTGNYFRFGSKKFSCNTKREEASL